MRNGRAERKRDPMINGHGGTFVLTTAKPHPRRSKPCHHRMGNPVSPSVSRGWCVWWGRASNTPGSHYGPQIALAAEDRERGGSTGRSPRRILPRCGAPQHKSQRTRAPIGTWLGRTLLFPHLLRPLFPHVSLSLSFSLFPPSSCQSLLFLSPVPPGQIITSSYEVIRGHINSVTELVVIYIRGYPLGGTPLGVPP